MIVEFASVAGMDDSVDQMSMFHYSQKHPLVEWGILISSGKPKSRYPSTNWINQLAKIAKSFHSTMGYRMNLAAHLCGKWVSDINKGEMTFANNVNWDSFQRIQLNIGSLVDQGILDVDNVLHAIREIQDNTQKKEEQKEFIIQIGDGAIYAELMGTALDIGLNVVPVFDKSRGKGESSISFPQPFARARANGYAGGLKADNIRGKLKLLSMVFKKYPSNTKVWMDMETGARNNDDNVNLTYVFNYIDACHEFNEKTLFDMKASNNEH